MEKKIRIGVSKLAPNYATWLRKLFDDPEIIDFYNLPLGEALYHVSRVEGLLLTGGNDIHPDLYGRNEDLPYCRDIDAKRDELEMELIELGFKFNIPMLGICRGQQILNVAMKGDLYADIPAMVDTEIIHAGKEDVYHPVKIIEDSALFRIIGSPDGTVNSAHHQAIKDIASGFLASAFSPDGLVEAIETEPSGSSHVFCMAVQWHPERMDFDNPLSVLLGKGFVGAVSGRR